MDPLARLFGSFPRLKLLRLFLFNDDQNFTVADAASRTKTATAVVRKELNALVAAGVVKKRAVKAGSTYSADKRFVHLDALQEFLRTTTTLGATEILTAVKRAGALRLVVLSGIFTNAVDTKVDLLIVGDKLDEKVLDSSVRKLEAEFGRELRFAAFTTKDFRYRVGVYDRLIRDVLDFPNRILLDKLGLRASD